ncbi:hypothetical protein AAJP47_07940 [Psychrobacter sp. B38]|uniref:hypothetical protein n=1 Tax=Psychrobacter sp. B38 TaxID=3143538 RepID=UPI00320C1B45
MSNEKNGFDLDFDEKLAQIVNKKSRQPTNNNIYERFINRVENGEDANSDSYDLENVPSPPLENRQILSESQTDDSEEAFELTIDPLEFMDQEIEKPIAAHSETAQPTNSAPQSFADMQLDDDTFSLDLGFDDDAGETTTHTPNADSQVTQDAPTQPAVDEPVEDSVKEIATSHTKPASDKKLLIIGMMLGSLLIGAVVAILIFTGILSPSTTSGVPNAVDISANNAGETAAVTDNDALAGTAQAPTTVDNPLSADTTSDNPVATTLQQGSSTNDSQKVVTNDAESNAAASITTDTSEVEPAITYEDFREESQNTLYRETND